LSTAIQEEDFVQGEDKKNAVQKTRNVERLRDVVLKEERRKANKPIYLVRYE
jgi:hypothetical protein